MSNGGLSRGGQRRKSRASNNWYYPRRVVPQDVIYGVRLNREPRRSRQSSFGIFEFRLFATIHNHRDKQSWSVHLAHTETPKRTLFVNHQSEKVGFRRRVSRTSHQQWKRSTCHRDKFVKRKHTSSLGNHRTGRSWQPLSRQLILTARVQWGGLLLLFAGETIWLTYSVCKACSSHSG